MFLKTYFPWSCAVIRTFSAKKNPRSGIAIRFPCQPGLFVRSYSGSPDSAAEKKFDSVFHGLLFMFTFVSSSWSLPWGFQPWFSSWFLVDMGIKRGCSPLESSRRQTEARLETCAVAWGHRSRARLNLYQVTATKPNFIGGINMTQSLLSMPPRGCGGFPSLVKKSKMLTQNSIFNYAQCEFWKTHQSSSWGHMNHMVCLLRCSAYTGSSKLDISTCFMAS